MAVKRAYSYEDIDRITFETIEVSEDWKPHLGEPQLGNSHWLVYGGSGEGKTSYVLSAVRMLCQNDQKVHYNTTEEGLKKSFKMALKRNNLKGVKGFNYQQENLIQLLERLMRKKQARIVVIDSVQYFFRGMQSKHYFDFISKFTNTTFIWISGADGNKPKGKIADDIYYDADIVIHIKDFEAIVEKNRFEAYEPKIIWDEEYNKRRMKLLKQG